MRLPQCSLAPTHRDRLRTEITLDVGGHTDVEEPAYLADILVLDPAYLLNVRGAL